jgi:hypothetical protein
VNVRKHLCKNVYKNEALYCVFCSVTKLKRRRGARGRSISDIEVGTTVCEITHLWRKVNLKIVQGRF